MKNPTKSVIVANDIVGLGKVALSTALPVLSACQIEVIPLPTVLLSSHTGGFENISITKLNQATTGFLTQWNTINFSVDGLMTGYFNSQEQLHQIADSKQRKLAGFVDPIMADNGRLYAGYQQDFVTVMQQFCQNADVITPNITEACLLADVPYLGEDYTRKDIEEFAFKGFKNFNNKHVILTGVSFKAGQIGLAHFNQQSGSVTYHMSKAYPHHFFGTGDLLCAVLGAGYFHGLSLDKNSRSSA